MEENKDGITFCRFFFKDSVEPKTARIIMDDLNGYLDKCWARCGKCNKYFKRRDWDIKTCPNCSPKKKLSAEHLEKIKKGRAVAKAAKKTKAK